MTHVNPLIDLPICQLYIHLNNLGYASPEESRRADVPVSLSQTGCRSVTWVNKCPPVNSLRQAALSEAAQVHNRIYGQILSQNRHSQTSFVWVQVIPTAVVKAMNHWQFYPEKKVFIHSFYRAKWYKLQRYMGCCKVSKSPWQRDRPDSKNQTDAYIANTVAVYWLW